MLYHWATGDSVVSKGQIVGIVFHTGIWIHFVWMCSTLANVKLTSGWPKILMNALQIPAKFKCSQGTVFCGLERFSSLLKRLAYTKLGARAVNDSQHLTWLDLQWTWFSLKADFQSVLRTLETLFTTFVLFHLRRDNMKHFASTYMK